jgi:hypothetical protein
VLSLAVSHNQPGRCTADCRATCWSWSSSHPHADQGSNTGGSDSHRQAITNLFTHQHAIADSYTHRHAVINRCPPQPQAITDPFTNLYSISNADPSANLYFTSNTDTLTNVYVKSNTNTFANLHTISTAHISDWT